MLSSCAAIVTILLNITPESTNWSPPCVVLVLCCSASNGFIPPFRLKEAPLEKVLSNVAGIVLPTYSAFLQLISSPSVDTSPVDSKLLLGTRKGFLRASQFRNLRQSW